MSSYHSWLYTQQVDICHNPCFHLPLIGGKKEVTAAPAITTAKAGDRIKLVAKSLSADAFNSVFSLAEDYISDKSLLQEIINMPARSFVSFKMAV